MSQSARQRLVRSLILVCAMSFALAGCGGGGAAGSAGSGTWHNAPQSYPVGGTISGLAGTVTLQDNGKDNLIASSNGSFSFPTQIPGGGAYDVTVLTQPVGQSCTVTAGVGTVSGSVTNVAVACTSSMYSVGGSVSGLNGGTVVLQNNGSENLTVSTNGTFAFATKLSSGGAYNVTVLTQPAGQTCSVSTGAGTISGNNVTNVTVTCAANTYGVGGAVSGLTGSVVLQNNHGDNLTVAANGTFTFPTRIATGSPYSVTVLTQPGGQSCSVSNGTGVIAAANVTNVAIACKPAFTIGGTVTGLNGTMVLQNNGADSLTVATNGSFFFKPPLSPAIRIALPCFPCSSPTRLARSPEAAAWQRRTSLA